MSLPYVILTVLSTRDATGYDITKEFSYSIGYFWKASHQQVYRELNKLAANEMVTCELQPQSGKPDKKIYSITDKGRESLAGWFDQPIAHPAVRDEFAAKLYACEVQPSEGFSDQLQLALSDSRKLVQFYQDIESSHYSDVRLLNQREKIERLALRRNLLTRQAWNEWAQEVLSEIA
ncbi:PadR family transcriptional regulator [Vibrio gallicus]|uniref:PadR family transcriptional regulator n=1 Tax=Vibrio gallicus TaxID=190897 RepID=UPI0021C4245B|nr:PadR family transcriptional regulator [Vibrio gallicus]